MEKTSIEVEELKKLIHHKDCTCGLWATDRPLENLFNGFLAVTK